MNITHTPTPEPFKRLAVICTICGLVRKAPVANGPCPCVALVKEPRS